METAAYAGVAGLTNGRLLEAIEGRFDVLVTADGNLHHQQDVIGHRIAVVVLQCKTNRIRDLLPLIPTASIAISTIEAGKVRLVLQVSATAQ